PLVLNHFRTSPQNHPLGSRPAAVSLSRTSSEHRYPNKTRLRLHVAVLPRSLRICLIRKALSLTSWRHLTGELRTEDLLSSALEQEAHEGGRGTPALQGRRSAFSPRGQGSIPVPRTGPGHGRLRPEPCRTAGRVRFRPAPGSGVPGGRAAAGGRGSGGGAGGGEVLCPALLVAVALDHVDPPRFAAGAVHPHLVLYRVAAGGVLLLEGGQARLLEAGRGGVHL